MAWYEQRDAAANMDQYSAKAESDASGPISGAGFWPLSSPVRPLESCSSRIGRQEVSHAPLPLLCRRL